MIERARASSSIKVIITDMYIREAGKFTDNKTGQEIEFGEAIKLHYIREDDPNCELIKATVAPEVEKEIIEVSRSVRWGSIAELIVRGKQVISVKLLSNGTQSQQPKTNQ
jgi:hypothetical protein